MVEPTPLLARAAKPNQQQSAGISVQEFTDKFEENFFELLGLELSDEADAPPAEEAISSEDEALDAGEINMAIADGCCTYATQKIAALSSHFASDTTEQETLMLQNVNDFIKAGETAFHHPLTQKQVNDLLHQCLVKTSVDLFRTNIFPSPAIQR